MFCHTERQSRVISFSSGTNDMASTGIRDRRAIPAALDANQPTISFAPETEGQRTKPADREILGSWSHAWNQKTFMIKADAPC
jgi:hypothetical protein